jgi:hypothetical protein
MPAFGGKPDFGLDFLLLYDIAGRFLPPWAALPRIKDFGPARTN